MNLVTYPDKRLYAKCEVVPYGEDLSELIAALRHHMKELNGVGMAANQLGVLKQVFLLRDKVVVNPYIHERSGNPEVTLEGCLSFPGKSVRTRRMNRIFACYQNENYKEVQTWLEGLDAIIFQHEFDHLNGKTMMDRQFNGRIK